MKSRILLVLTVSAVLLFTMSLASQTVKRFDMGDRGSPTAPGYTPVLSFTSYTPSLGYGWTTPLGRAFNRTAIVPNIKTPLPTALIQDGISGTNDGVFQVDVAAGTYLCQAYLGDPGTLRALTPREKLDVIVNGVEVVSEAYARTSSLKARFDDQAYGGIKRVRFLASPQAGALKITFHCDRTSLSINSVLGLEIYPYTRPPIFFDHTAKALEASAPYKTMLDPALKAFNSHDYIAARTLLDGVKDPLARAWGYAWLMGWMRGEEADVDPALLATTRALLEGLNQPDNPSVAVLLADVKDMEYGLLMNRLRGYSSSYHPESLNNIVYNLSAAVALFEQMDDDILSVPDPARPECPFFPKAQFLIARNMYSRYTGVGDPQAPWAAMWLGIFKNLFAPVRATLFPKAQNLEVFTFFATHYGINGGLVKNWTGTRHVPTFNPAAAWWAPHTEFPRNAAAPDWAQYQRDYINQFRNAGAWWIKNRLHDGEIGGGGGDDVEGAALLSLPTITRTEPGNMLELGLKECLEKVLFGSEVDQEEGYFANCGDVEHAGEYTSNPLFALLPTNFGYPAHLSLSTRTIRNMDEKADPVPWTQLVGTNQRHFKSYRFGARSVCGAARDIPCNIRAIIPGFFLMDYNNSPRIKQLFDELARAWAANAMSTAQSKPIGIPPTAVSLTAPPVFGTGGSWWMNGGYYDLPNGSQYYSYLYALFLAAYHNSTAPDRHLFLEPVLHSGYLSYKRIKGLLSGTNPGQPRWTADTLKGPISSALAEAYPALAQDPNLNLTPTDLQQLSLVISTDAPAYLKYLHQSNATTKDKSSLAATFDRARCWMRYFWVLGTSSVSYTDRTYVMNQNSHQLLYSSMMGGAFSVNPTYVLSWMNPDTKAGDLDIAALVHNYTNTSLDVLLFNFGPAKRDLAFRLWRRLEFGKYTVAIGNDSDHDDRMDGPPHTSFSVDYDARGKTLTLPGVPNGVLQKVELRKTASLPGGGALLPDLGIGDSDITLARNGQVAVVIHNLGSADAVGGTMELYEGTRLLGSHAVPNIPAPNDLTPRSVPLKVPYRPVLPNADLTVKVKLPATTREITLFNNLVTVNLSPDDPVISVANKTGIASFDIAMVSPYDGGKFYCIAPGITGTSPGYQLAPGMILPLTPDWLTQYSLFTGGGLFVNSLGTLDGGGKGTLLVRGPDDPVLKGVIIYFAGTTFTGEGFRAVSEALPVQLN